MVSRNSRNLRGLGVLAVAVVGALCASSALLTEGVVVAEPSLANLLRGEAPKDPLQPYADQLASLERRPFARSAAVQRVLSEARAVLTQARAAYRSGAPEDAVARRLALVKAALSAADRLEARAFAAAALARLKVQVDEAEASALRAKAALEDVREHSAQQDRQAQPASAPGGADAGAAGNERLGDNDRGQPAP